MLVVLSPAKKLDFSGPCPFEPSEPQLISRTKQLARVTKGLEAEDLARLMKLSPGLAQLNFERFQSFKASPRPRGSRPAAYAFAGDTYTGLRATEFDAEEMRFAQAHLRILSGLYGLLRPLDAMLPYRLEMGTRLETPQGRSLYEFWGGDIARQLNGDMKEQGADTLVNLASQEYFSAVELSELDAPVVTPVFKEERGGTLKIISFSAKRARGAMARYIVKGRLQRVEALKKFREDGYRHSPRESDESTWVFVRKQP